MLNSQDGARQLTSTNLGANPHHLQPFFLHVEKTRAVPNPLLGSVELFHEMFFGNKSQD